MVCKVPKRRILEASPAFKPFHLSQPNRIFSMNDAPDSVFHQDPNILPWAINPSRHLPRKSLQEPRSSSRYNTDSYPVPDFTEPSPWQPTQGQRVLFEQPPALIPSSNPALDAVRERCSASLQLSEPFLRLLAHARLAIAPPSAPCSIPTAVPWQRLATLPSSSSCRENNIFEHLSHNGQWRRQIAA